MLEGIQSFFKLRWTNEPQFRPLPSHIKRTFVDTPNGELELLICEPKVNNTNTQLPCSPPIFFIHGGCGSAGVWLEWMTYLHDHGYQGTAYAYSLRNHGASYSVPYFRMVFRTTFDDLASDLTTCIKHVRSLPSSHDSDPVLVGHSSGGGLVQYVLSRSMVRARGLCLLGAVPHFGNLDLYWNWAKHDPWFFIRALFHLEHPNSPLNTPRLVHGAFFGRQFPLSRVPEFMRWMPAYEAMGWPMGMAGTWLGWLFRRRNEWLNTKDILESVSDVRNARLAGKDKVCVMVGSEDMLVDLSLCKRQAKEYRDGVTALESEISSSTMTMGASAPSTPAGRRSQNMAAKVEKEITGVSTERENDVRLVVVEGAGHHTQNDIQYEQAAEALKAFAEQI